ncbi:hypothetical protein [Pseudofrankia asymbiotica]
MLALLSTSLPNRGIAERLGISENARRVH